jgi:hypothetical protein
MRGYERFTPGRRLSRLHSGSIRAIVTLIVELRTGAGDGLRMPRRRHTGAERTEHQRMRAPPRSSAQSSGEFGMSFCRHFNYQRLFCARR